MLKIIIISYHGFLEPLLNTWEIILVLVSKRYSSVVIVYRSFTAQTKILYIFIHIRIKFCRWKCSRLFIIRRSHERSFNRIQNHNKKINDLYHFCYQGIKDGLPCYEELVQKYQMIECNQEYHQTIGTSMKKSLFPELILKE